MSDAASREWRFYLDDMIDFARKVIVYTEGLDQAATHIPEAVRAENAQIPWRQVIATRNRLIHGYLGIDNDTLWSIVRDDIVPLLDKLVALKARLA